MDLRPDQAAFKRTVREFATAEIRPRARHGDETETFPEGVWDGLAELGLTAMTVPEAHGGLEVDGLTYAIANEGVAYGHLAVATALSAHCLVTSCLAEFGSDAQHERWLPGLAEGRPVGAFALSEPEVGSNPAGMSTEAKPDGDGYRINGTKQWITNGERSDLVVLFAKTDAEDAGTITQFLVPKGTGGLSVGPREEKLGLRASDTTTLQFEDAWIPEENRLTPVGGGLSAALSVLTEGRVGIAAQAVGLAQSALDLSTEYANEREQFGQSIGSFQAIRHKIAEMYARTQSGRLLTYDAARKLDDGDAPELAASTAKYVASEAAVEVANEALQIHGGYGYTTDFEVERLYRDAKITTIYEGTTEIQKQIIADALV